MNKGVGLFLVSFLAVAGVLFYVNKEGTEQPATSIVVEKQIDREDIPLPSKQEGVKEESTAINCDTLQQEGWYSLAQAQINLDLIKSKPMAYYEARLDENVIDLIAFKSGIGAPSGRTLREKNKHPVNNPPFYYGVAELSEPQDLKIINSYLDSKNTQAFLAAISSGELNTKAVYYSKSAMVFLVEKLIDDGISNPDFFTLLLDYNIPIFFSDLVAATQVGLPVNIVSKMQTAGGLDASTTLYYTGNKLSLLDYAIRYGQYELALYWLKEGSPTEPDEFTYNALDLLAINYTKFSAEQLEGLARELFKTGLIPKAERSAKRLNTLLTQATKQEFNHLLTPLGDSAFNQTNLKVAQKHVDAFFIELLSQENSQDLVKEFPKHCLRKLGKRVVRYAIKHGFRIEQPEQTVNDHNQQTSSNRPAPSVSNVQSVISEDELGTIQNIQDKTQVEQRIAEDVAEKASHIKKDFATQRESQELDFATIQQIIELAMAKKWGEALALVEPFKPEEKLGIYTALLNIALSQGADISLIERLLGSGALLNESAITYLVQSDNAVLAEQLLNHGLNLYYIDPLGYNAITNSVKNRSINILKFLVQHGVSVVDYTTGFDALDFALKDFKMYSHKDAFIKVLINAGIEVETSHKQWVNNMLTSNPDAYFYLTVRYPMLVD